MTIYFDYNANYPLLAKVKKHINDITEKLYNPSSLYKKARQSKMLIEEARDNIKYLIGENIKSIKWNIYFTSGATESNNWILNEYINKNADIFISTIEHDSVNFVQNFYKNSYAIKVDDNFLINLDDLEDKLQNSANKNKLISFILAHHETGVIQNIDKITEIGRKYGADIHIDATQIFGKHQFDINDYDIDYVTLSGHKFGGLCGVGALIVRHDKQISPLIMGGGQEKGLRSGTENSLAISAMGMAGSYMKDNLLYNIEHNKKIRDYFEEKITSKFDNVKILGNKNAQRLSNTSFFVGSKNTSDVNIILFDLEDIAISNGSACSSGKIKYNNLLYRNKDAMNSYNEDDIKSALRLSFGPENTIEEVDKFIEIYSKLNINNE